MTVNRYLSHRDQFPGLFDELGVETAAEVGVAAGWFARVMLQSRSLKKLFLIDPWPNPADASYRQQTFELAASDSRVEIVELYSDQAADRFAADSLDFVYLDALHEYEFMRHDVRRWWPKARLLLGGHDYVLWNHAVNVPVGVMMAVEEFAYLTGHAVYVTGAAGPTWIERLRAASAAAELADGGPFGSHFPSWYIFKCES